MNLIFVVKITNTNLKVVDVRYKRIHTFLVSGDTKDLSQNEYNL